LVSVVLIPAFSIRTSRGVFLYFSQENRLHTLPVLQQVVFYDVLKRTLQHRKLASPGAHLRCCVGRPHYARATMWWFLVALPAQGASGVDISAF
jgi:hypothetical protein